MIRDVVLHINNEQPLRADLFELPESDMVLLRCTNVRTMNGTRPVYIDDLNSIIYFPMLHLRFIEILPATQGAEHLALGPGEERVPVQAGQKLRIVRVNGLHLEVEPMPADIPADRLQDRPG